MATTTSFRAFDTPCLRIDLDRLEHNLREMAAEASAHNVGLRPHIKTHKMAEIARRQMNLGAIGLTSAKLSEAEALANADPRLTEFFICYPIVGDGKLRRLRAFSRKAHIMTVVESQEGVDMLAAAMAEEDSPLDVILKIDVGMHRVGIAPERAGELADAIGSAPSLRLRGVCIHEGTVYGVADPDERSRIAVQQALRLVEVAEFLRRQGHEIDIVSTGSTPGASATLQVTGITEIRPGNYVFNDAIQVALDVVDLSRCALSVVATIVSHAAPDRAVIDAGSKALSLDRGAHGLTLAEGYGTVVGRPGIVIEKLSEEHGWLRLEAGEAVAIGEQLEIVPNHACPVVNNFREAIVTSGGQVTALWPVDARGCMV